MAEVQILKGLGLDVTDRRIAFEAGEIAATDIRDPQIEATSVSVSVAPTLVTIGIVLVAMGAFFGGPPVWITGLGLMAFAAFGKVKRSGFAVSVKSGGERKPVYSTAHEADAKLALAALIEAQRRAGTPGQEH